MYNTKNNNSLAGNDKLLWKTNWFSMKFENNKV